MQKLGSSDLGRRASENAEVPVCKRNQRQAIASSRPGGAAIRQSCSLAAGQWRMRIRMQRVIESQETRGHVRSWSVRVCASVTHETAEWVYRWSDACAGRGGVGDDVGVGVGGIYVKGALVPRQREPALRQSRGATVGVG